MSAPPKLYGGSLALFTDLYEITMARAYWKTEMADREAVFHLYFRKHPFGGRYTLAAGLASAVDFLRRFAFDPTDLEYLATLTDGAGETLFDSAFLNFLAKLELTCDIDAIPEGSLVYPHEPLLRVRGPLIECQLLETALLNIINFQTLIATKAARVVEAARGDGVLEFGARRAQGVDGAVSASRAAFIGGCAATSNVLAGKLYGIPVRGTHAHSWIMSFDDEESAFDAWARAMPNSAIFLVDTYDTLEGVRRAIDAGKRLAARGRRLQGIRLDSGDLAALSREARRMLDAAGFEDATIVGSGDLDEAAISDLKSREAAIALWGVGTHLVTAKGDPALGGVYKLAAIRGDDGEWNDRVKLSETPDKSTNPGIQQVRRTSEASRPVRDIIYDERQGVSTEEGVDLLQPVFRRGACVYREESVQAIRERARERVSAAAAGPDCEVLLDPKLEALKERLAAAS